MRWSAPLLILFGVANNFPADVADMARISRPTGLTLDEIVAARGATLPSRQGRQETRNGSLA